MIQAEIVIKNETGIHARPASILTQQATSYKSDIFLVSENKTCDAKSIINILSMGMKNGEKILLQVDGVDEIEALDGIRKLFDTNFGE